MDLIYRVGARVDTDGKPILTQMESHGSGLGYYDLRFVHVWAQSLTAARAIQRQWRASQH